MLEKQSAAEWGPMASLPIPENSVLIVIDYQPPQVNSILSMDRQILVNNIVDTIRMARLYKLPIILSTVNVENIHFFPMSGGLRKGSFNTMFGKRSHEFFAGAGNHGD